MQERLSGGNPRRAPALGPLRRVRSRISAPARPGGPPGSSTVNLLPVPLTLPVVMATGRLGVGETLEALNAAVGPGSPVWFKETNARHLRVRDFLAPRSALQARFRDGQVGAGWPGTCSLLQAHPGPPTRPSARRCRNACSVRSPACRAPGWPPCCAARQHPRVYRSSYSAPLSSSVCSGPWPPTLLPPSPPRQARDLFCIAPHCAATRAHSA